MTLSRVAIIPIFVGLFFIEHSVGQWLASGLFAIAALSDFLDGYFARIRGEISAFGTFLDPVADKALISAALLIMAGFGQISGMVIIPAVIILCREIIVSGLREYLASISTGLPVSKLAKWKTAIQMAAIGILIVGDDAHPFVTSELPVRTIGEVGLWCAAAITLITGYIYLREGLRHMQNHNT